MGITKKSSTGITVDGARYCWRVTSEGYKGHDADALVLFVVLEDHGKSAIRGSAQVYHDPKHPPYVIMPRHVAAIIRHARKGGWNPEQDKKDFLVENLEAFIADRAPGKEADGK